MNNNELFTNDEVMDVTFDTELEVNMEMDDVNPWMVIATNVGTTVA